MTNDNNNYIWVEFSDMKSLYVYIAKECFYVCQTRIIYYIAFYLFMNTYKLYILCVKIHFCILLLWIGYNYNCAFGIENCIYSCERKMNLLTLWQKVKNVSKVYNRVGIAFTWPHIITSFPYMAIVNLKTHS